MSDFRINTSPDPIPDKTEANEGSHSEVQANGLDVPKSPAAIYRKATKSELPEHLQGQQRSCENDLSNAVEAGMQSASEWLARQGKLMPSEVEDRRPHSKNHSASPGAAHGSGLEKK